MTMELNETDRRNTLAWLAEKHPGAAITLIGAVDVAWSGWECDTAAVLYTADGIAGIQIVNQVMAGIDEPPATVLGERVVYYRQLADKTEALLARYHTMGGSNAG